MSDYNDQIKFDGGLNFDDDERIVPQGDYIDAFSIINGSRESGAVMNMQGNTLKPFTLPTGRNKCIGGERDIKRNAIVYFIWNSSGNHCILHYFCETQTIEEILYPRTINFVQGILTIPIAFSTSFLGFTEFNKIHSCNIVDESLLWTDGNVAPRKIDIERAKYFMAGVEPAEGINPYDISLATGDDAVKQQFINAIKYAPLVKPLVSLGTDSTKKTNFLIKKMVQARYRYIYDGNEKSVWSTGSFVTVGGGAENINGPIGNYIINNYMTTSVNTGHSTVKAIEIAYRFGNEAIWYRLDEPIKKYDNNNQRLLNDFTDYNFNFYNDRVLIAVATDDSDRNYDAVPQLAATQDIIENRLFYANTTEGYENPEPIVDLVVNNRSVEMNELNTTYLITSGNIEFTIPAYNPGIIYPGVVISVNIVWTDPPTFNGIVNYTVTEDDMLMYPYGLAVNYANFMGTVTGMAMYTTYSGSDAVVNFNVNPLNFTKTDLVVIQPKTQVTSFKKGASHRFGIVYYDEAGRDGGVVTNADMVAYAPSIPEIYPTITPIDDVNCLQTYIDFQINHVPPIWAKKYQIVYAKGNLRKYVQFVLKAWAGITTNGNVEISLEYLMYYKNNRIINGSIDFQFEPGDKLRFISNATNYCNNYVEVNVVSYNPTNFILTVSYFDWDDIWSGMTPPITSEGVLVEYFAYKDEVAPENQFYFEIGQVYDIIDYGTSIRRHAGEVDGIASDQNAAYTNPATVRLDRGDTYIYRRYQTPTTYERIVESENFSDYYRSSNFDYSRVQGVINGKTEHNGQLIRYGGRYVPNSVTNDLLSFDGADYDLLQTVYGPICRIIAIGYTLKCLQTKKLTSIYVNRSMTYNASGSPQIILTDRVIGTKDPSNLDFGCQHPESVCKDDRQMYFYDINNGAFIQDSANGPYPISNYKANTYFKNKSAEIRNSPDNQNIFVYVESDNFNGTINVTFSDENTTSNFTNDTIIYRTDNNRWISREPYICDYVVSNGLVIISFKDGQLYLHNDNAQLRGNFYGIQYDPYITFVSNINPEIVKTFDNVAINSNKLWFSPNNTDIKTQANGNYSNGMASRILANKFRAKEGVWYADYMRDLNTPNVTNPIVSGRRLKGNYLIHKMQTAATDEAILFSVLVKSTYSEMSG